MHVRTVGTVIVYHADKGYNATKKMYDISHQGVTRVTCGYFGTNLYLHPWVQVFGGLPVQVTCQFSCKVIYLIIICTAAAPATVVAIAAIAATTITHQEKVKFLNLSQGDLIFCPSKIKRIKNWTGIISRHFYLNCVNFYSKSHLKKSRHRVQERPCLDFN